MVLVDSLYVNSSGGLLLLQYLVSELNRRGLPFHLLADQRCKGLFDGDEVTYLIAKHSLRRDYYLRHQHNYSAILCFGNIPPLIKLDVPVYTYFHNINLLTLRDIYFFKWKISAFFKRIYFFLYKKNTTYWIVQTTNTRDELITHLHEPIEKVIILPFFDIPLSIKEKSNATHGDDYAYIGSYTGSKGHDELLKAWEILHQNGMDFTLHLTVREGAPIFPAKIKLAQQEGLKIINHGQIPFEAVGDLYGKAKAIIYPSKNESLGLGIVEAISAGCDVIGSDLPFIHSVCQPSCTFNPRDPQSIADAVVRYEKGICPKSTLSISNGIDELIDLLF